MNFPILSSYLALSLLCAMGFAQETSTQPAQAQGNEEKKPSSPTMRLYDVPPVKEPSGESPEEAADYLRLSQITDPTAGAPLIEEFLKKYPDSKRAALLHYGAVAVYQQLNNYDKLIEHGEKFLETSPSNITVLSTLGLAYASHGEVDKCVEKASKAINLLDSLAKPASVTDEARWTNQRNQLFAMNYASLGMSSYTTYELERKKENETEAGSQGKAPATTSPGTPSGKETAAELPKQAATQTGSKSTVSLAKSLGYFSKAVEYQPRYDYAQFQLGVIYARRSEVDKAIDAFAKAHVIGGGFASMAKQNLEVVYKVKNKNSLDGIDQVLAKAKEELPPVQPPPQAKPDAAPTEQPQGQNR